MKKRVSKILAVVMMFALTISLLAIGQTNNISHATVYVGKFDSEEFENIKVIDDGLQGSISLEQAKKIAQSIYSDLYYVHYINFERSNGERYYVIYVKDKVDNHYTTLTQLFVSFDGKICVEGYVSGEKIYVYSGENLVVRVKALKAYSKILCKKDNLNESEDKLKTYFSICDLNCDHVPELIVSEGEHILSKKKYYTFENDEVVEIEGPDDDETYPVYGQLYSIPSRETYAFYRGGPGTDDSEGNGYMPHIIMEYKIQDNKIKLENELLWNEYESGDKAGINEYYMNGEDCTAEDYQEVYDGFDSQIDFVPNSEVNRIDWGVNISENREAEHKKSIVVLSTEKSLTIKTGKSMWLGFGILDQDTGVLDDKWKKMSLAVSNPEIIELSEYKETEYGYSLEVIGKKQGATNITITDTDSGINKIITVFVKDEYAKTYSYSINNIASFYPKNEFEKNIQTNIYDLNGLYVNNYKCTKSNGSYNVSFDIYNSKYYYGAVDIYDENGMWIGYEEIDKYSDISSFYDTLNQAHFVITDTVNGKMLTYEQASFAKHKHIDINVPEGGYYTISNNVSESQGTFLSNSFDILFEGVSNAFDLFKSGSVKESALTKFMKEAKKSFADRLIEARNEGLKNNVKKKAQEIMLDSMKAKIKDIIKEGSKGSLKDKLKLTNNICSDMVNLLEDMLSHGLFNIEWKQLFEDATGVSESVITKFSGPAGIALEGCFAMNDYTSKILMVKQMAESLDNTYVTVFSSVDDDYVNPYGIIVDDNENIDKESVLQVFRVSDSDTIKEVLDSDNPFEIYELYNICFVKDDNLVQPNGKVKVQIPIPNGMKGNTCKVYRQEENSDWEILDAQVQGNYLVFETNHFSMYALVGESDNLVITSFPKKLNYTEGDRLDTNGLMLNMNGQLITEGYICEPTVLSGSGKQVVKITYGHSSVDFEVNVKKKISAISVGTKEIIDNMKYKVTKINNNGTGEVSLIGTNNKKTDKEFTSLKIADIVKIKGKKFKVISIGNNAFRDYRKLKAVTIGNNIKKIGKNAFYGCENLKKIIIKSKQLKINKVQKNAFKFIYPKADVKVPKTKINLYKKIIRARGGGNKIKIHK